MRALTRNVLVGLPIFVAILLTPTRVTIEYCHGNAREFPLPNSNATFSYYIHTADAFSYYLAYSTYAVSVQDSYSVSIYDPGSDIHSIEVTSISNRVGGESLAITTNLPINLDLNRTSFNGYAGKGGHGYFKFKGLKPAGYGSELHMRGFIKYTDGSTQPFEQVIKAPLRVKRFWTPLVKHIFNRLTIT